MLPYWQPTGSTTTRFYGFVTHVIEALKEWSLDAPTWDILHWINRLLQPSVARGRRMSGPRQGLFLVFEGIDGSGKTFHMDAVKEALIPRSRAIHSVVFPNNRQVFEGLSI